MVPDASPETKLLRAKLQSVQLKTIELYRNHIFYTQNLGSHLKISSLKQKWRWNRNTSEYIQY